MLVDSDRTSTPERIQFTLLAFSTVRAQTFLGGAVGDTPPAAARASPVGPPPPPSDAAAQGNTVLTSPLLVRGPHYTHFYLLHDVYSQTLLAC